APRRRRPTPENPQTAPQDPRRPDLRAAVGSAASAEPQPARTRAAPGHQGQQQPQAAACPELAAQHEKPPWKHSAHTTPQQPEPRQPARRNVTPKRENRFCREFCDAGYAGCKMTRLLLD